MVLMDTSSSTSGRTMSSAGAIVGVGKGGFKETVGSCVMTRVSSVHRQVRCHWCRIHRDVASSLFVVAFGAATPATIRGSVRNRIHGKEDASCGIRRRGIGFLEIKFQILEKIRGPYRYESPYPLSCRMQHWPF